MNRLVRFLVPAFLTLFLAVTSSAPAQDAANRNIRFGMPAWSAEPPKDKENFIIQRMQYVLSYNDRTKTPNWVSWQLVKSDIAKAVRGPFEPDPNLPKDFLPVTSNVYNKSGFDRGHMCNSKDRSDTQENNDATFYLTNILPQAPNNNQKTWEHLEEYCRTLAQDGQELQIVAGPHGVGGTGKNGFASKIGAGKVKVTVPSHTWKVVLVLPSKGAQPSKRTRTIAVIVPNNQDVNPDWTQYRVSVQEVEELTGLRFFPDIPEEVAAIIKAEADREQVIIPAPRKAAKKKKRAA